MPLPLTPDGEPSNAWDFVADAPQLARVILICESFTCGFTLAARKALVGVANLHRALENCGPTATGLKSRGLNPNALYFSAAGLK